MSGMLIGSSNVYRFYRSESFPTFKNYSMVRCTDIESFRAIMGNLEEDDKEVIVAVVENFLATGARDETTDEGRTEAMGKTIHDYCQIIKNAAMTNKETKISVALPVKRPKFEWFQTNLDATQTAIKEIFASFKLDNITSFEAIPEGCQQFEQDQIHFTKESGQIYLEGILTKSEIFFKAEIHNVADVEAEDDLNPTERLEKRIEQLENHVINRERNDNQVFARMREDFDTLSNKAKEDRIIITGITSKVIAPTDPEERKKWIRKIVQDIFENLIPSFGGKIMFVNQMRNKGYHIPLVEVKLDSPANAGMIRKAFAEKKKDPAADLGRIFIANCVNLATRVRVDILKAIARKLSNKNVSAHVVPFISRPVMHVRPTENAESGSVEMTYTFVDAASKFGHLVKQAELGEAYRRAGVAFKGQLAQNFIILKESGVHRSTDRAAPEAAPAAAMGEPVPGGSRKRTREDEDYREPQRGGRHGGGRGFYGKGSKVPRK